MSVCSFETRSDTLRETWHYGQSETDQLIQKYFKSSRRLGHVNVLRFARLNNRQPYDILNFLSDRGLLLSHTVSTRHSWYIAYDKLAETEALLYRFRHHPLPGGTPCRIKPCPHNGFRSWPICLVHAATFLTDLIEIYGEENGISRLNRALAAMHLCDTLDSVPVDVATSALMVSRAQMTRFFTTGAKTIHVGREIHMRSEQLWVNIIDIAVITRRQHVSKKIRPVNIRKYLLRLQ